MEHRSLNIRKDPVPVIKMTNALRCVPVILAIYIMKKENLSPRADANLLRAKLMNAGCIELSFSYVPCLILNHL